MDALLDSVLKALYDRRSKVIAETGRDPRPEMERWQWRFGPAARQALLYQVVDALGADNVVFATDFPHPDAKYPEAVQRFLDLPRVGIDDKRRIMWDNAVRLYGFDAASLPTVSSPSAAGAEQTVAG